MADPSAGEGLCTFGVVPEPRLAIPVIAALTTCTSGGLIPQARHGGSGVCAFAVVGSKFSGTGFEKEQIGQIQVAFLAFGGAGDGVYDRDELPWMGDEDEIGLPDGAEDGPGGRKDSDCRLFGFG